MNIDLGEGKYATIKEVDELRSGDRDAVEGAIEMRIDPESKEAFMPGNYDGAQRRALALRIVTGWNLEVPLPSRRPDSLDKLTLPQQRALWKGIQPHLDAINASDDDPAAADPDPTVSVS
jgi:hypothetical protein